MSVSQHLKHSDCGGLWLGGGSLFKAPLGRADQREWSGAQRILGLALVIPDSWPLLGDLIMRDH